LQHINGYNLDDFVDSEPYNLSFDSEPYNFHLFIQNLTTSIQPYNLRHSLRTSQLSSKGMELRFQSNENPLNYITFHKIRSFGRFVRKKVTLKLKTAR
jgi:hypothetical protein